MKSPLVSRELYEATVAERDRWRAAFDDLSARYQTLRLNGAVEALPPPAPRERDPVADAIHEASRGDPKLRTAMTRAARADRANGVSDAEILLSIASGIPTVGIP